MPHPTGSHKERDLRPRDLFAVASHHRPAATSAAPAMLRRTLAELVAMVTAGACSQAAAPGSSFAASHVYVFSTEAPRATEEVLTTGTYDYRPAGSVRTV